MKPKKIVTIGGGTGSFTLLSGLKKYPVEISSIVSMADDGGSTGVLRDELGVLPPGDVRQCLVALSEHPQILRELMNYRFTNGCLEGHNFGNIFLSALEKISGSFGSGVEEAARLLNIKGEVIPATVDSSRIYIKLKNNKIIKGEKELDYNKEIRRVGIKQIYLKPQAKACKKAIDRIRKADFIIIGPTDYYSGIIANLLIGGVAKAVRNSKARVIYNCNLTNKKGQTDNFDLDYYVAQINSHIGQDRIDYALFNTKRIPTKLVRKYEKKEGKGMIVKLDEAKKDKRNFKVIKADLLNEKVIPKNRSDIIAGTRSFIRHDSDKLARALMRIINK
jgi:uncharacterized cofD-like protein